MARKRSMVSGPRRKTDWHSAFVTGFVSVAANALSLQLLRPFVTGQPTLVRTRGNIGLLCTSAAGVRGLVGIGICAVSDRSRIIGTTALPRPLLDGNDDCWLWHTHVPMLGGTSADDVKTVLGAVSIPVDSKAMRKLPDDLAVVLIIESDTVAIQYVFGIRTLAKLA